MCPCLCSLCAWGSQTLSLGGILPIFLSAADDITPSKPHATFSGHKKEQQHRQSFPDALRGVITNRCHCPALKAAARPQAAPAGRSNSASRARPGMHKRTGSLDAATLNPQASNAVSLVIPPNLSGLPAPSHAQANHYPNVHDMGARAGRSSAAAGAGEPSRRTPAGSRRAENDENAGPDRCGTACRLLQPDWSLWSKLPWTGQCLLEAAYISKKRLRGHSSRSR